MKQILKRVDKFFAWLEYRQGWAQPLRQPRIKIHVPGMLAMGFNLRYMLEQADRIQDEINKTVTTLQSYGHMVASQQVIEWAKMRHGTIQDSAKELTAMARRGEKMPWD